MRILMGLVLAVVLTACGQATTGGSVSLGGDGTAGAGAEEQGGSEAPSAGNDGEGISTGDDGSMAMCIEGVPECDDMVVVTEPADGDCAVSSDGEMYCPGSSGGNQGAGSSPGSPGTGEILCDGTEPTAAAPPGTDCSAPAEPEGREVKPSPDGLASVHLIGWDRYTADGRQLTVHWYSGVEPCHVLHSVRVEEGAQRVTVTLREGTADADAACIEIAEAVKTTVRLDQPLGDRKVVDGAD